MVRLLPGVFMVFIMSLSTLSLIFTVFVIHIHHHIDDKSVPDWMKTIILYYCAKAVFLYPSNDHNNPRNGGTMKNNVDSTYAKDFESRISLNPDNETKSFVDADKDDDCLQFDNGRSHNYIMKQMNTDLSYIASTMKQHQVSSQKSDEWKAVARVVDRVMFYVTTAIFLCVTVYVYVKVTVEW